MNDKILVISVITELELKSLPRITKREANIIEQLIEDCEVVDLNREIKELVVEIRRKQKLKLPDAIIAASAKYAKLPVFTADKEFKKLKQQDVIIFEV